MRSRLCINSNITAVASGDDMLAMLCKTQEELEEFRKLFSKNTVFKASFLQNFGIETFYFKIVDWRASQMRASILEFEIRIFNAAMIVVCTSMGIQ